MSTYGQTVHYLILFMTTGLEILTNKTDLHVADLSSEGQNYQYLTIH